ncbi:MAG TPA: PfkB family carbohydrate kinase, partial [Terriglobales bacterium]|nr:PfkB family carbohydrate kinase [Terriglobales bacterium]
MSLVVGLGELLWDLLPEGKQLGGAPSNFAYISSLFGYQAVVVSRVGNDDLGRGLLGRLQQLKLDATYLQTDERYPTGTV